MFSKILSSPKSTAAWRLSIWTTIAFALGSAFAFGICYYLVSLGIRERSDQWLTGEAETLAEVSDSTPRDSLYDRVIEEVAQNAAREVPGGADSDDKDSQNSVFFYQTDQRGEPLWVGPASKDQYVQAIQGANFASGAPQTINIKGAETPYRVVARSLKPQGTLFLGLSDQGAAELLERLTRGFIIVWIGMVVLGFMISYLSVRRTLLRVEHITDTVGGIGSDDLGARLPETGKSDEIARLSRTFNRMLERIQASVHQLRTVTDGVAHDLKSPVTSIRGRLEVALLEGNSADWRESVAEAVEGLDRLSQFINTSLDLAEAEAGALALRRETVDFSSIVEQFVEIYMPALNERHHEIKIDADSAVLVDVDVNLMNRVLTNLLDNEMAHLPPGCRIHVHVRSRDGFAELAIEDNGPGFPAELKNRVFQRFVKGNQSTGHGLGLAFVDAVVQAHGGRVSILNREAGGAAIALTLPLAPVAVA
jgi:signal transduction histidine kinase